ncbi:MAG: hypothetical protein IRZ02_07380 [Acidothermus sp.]|nr:hypothetical protein [Acidothermus sp.]MCL6538223.1 hypothetical protein [Acidothermus sp.]
MTTTTRSFALRVGGAAACLMVAACTAGPTGSGPAAVPLPTTPSPSVPLTPSPSAVATPEGIGRITYGVDVNVFDRDIGLGRVPTVLSLANQIGAGAVRIGLDWQDAEPRPASYDWNRLDRLLALARANRLTVLLELGEEPSWDAPGGNRAAPPRDCATPQASCAVVRAFVGALVAHAAPLGLHYLVVRNEPQDFAKNWDGGTASDYAHYQQVVYQAAHEADPTILVLNGGTEDAPQLSGEARALGLSGSYGAKAAVFAQALYSDPNWCRSLDVLDLHVADHGPVYSPEIVRESSAALLRCDGNVPKPIWITECAYSALPAVQDSPTVQAELGRTYVGGEQGQARYLADVFNALSAVPGVVGINWTFLVDPNATTPPAGSSERLVAGAGDGLFDAELHPRPAAAAFHAIARGGHP